MPLRQFTLKTMLWLMICAGCLSALAAILPAEAWLSIAASSIILVGFVLVWKS